MIDVLNYNGKWVIVQFVGHALGDNDNNLLEFDTADEAADYANNELTDEDQEVSVAPVTESYGGYL